MALDRNDVDILAEAISKAMKGEKSTMSRGTVLPNNGGDEFDGGKKDRMSSFEKRRQMLIEEHELLEEITDELDKQGDHGEHYNELQKEKIDVETEYYNMLGREETLFEKNINNVKARFSGVLNGLKDISRGFKDVVNSMNSMLEPWAKADKAASDYAKKIGMSAAAMKELRKSAISNVVKSEIGIKYNMDSEELIRAQENYVRGVGRNIAITNTAQENLAAMYAVYGEETTNAMATGMEKFGINIDDTSKRMGKMHAEASKMGISLEKYTKNVQENLYIAQNYTFRNGLKGLESMAKKATALRLDMKQVEGFANNVNTVAGAIQTASKLQVLGGSIAGMADPLGMLNESLTDMEGLQDRIIRGFENMGQYNAKTGEVEVSAYNKQRIKEAANAMGMDYGSVMESIMTQGRRKEMDKQLEGSGIDKNTRERILNSGTIQNGKAGISIGGEFKTISDLAEMQRNGVNLNKIIVQATQDQSDDIKDIAQNLRSLLDIESGTKKQIKANQAAIAEKTGIGEVAKSVVDAIGNTSWMASILGHGANILSILGVIEGTLLMTNGVFKTLKGGKNVFKKFPKIGKGAGGVKAASKVSKTATKNIGETIEKQTAKTVEKQVAKSTVQRAAVEGAETAVVKKGGASIMRRGVKRAGTRAGIKVLGKTGAKLAASAAKGGGVGIIGAIGNVATDALVENGKIDKGGSAHMAMKVGSSALEGAGMGAMIGSIIPGIGTAVGAAVGTAVGAAVGVAKVNKIRNQQAVDAQLESKGLELKGKYSSKQLKEIESAMNGGKLSDRTRRELSRKGDIDVLNMIKGEQDKAKGKNDDEKKISRATISIDRATIRGRRWAEATDVRGHGLSLRRGVIGLSPIALGTTIANNIKTRKETGSGGAVLPSNGRINGAMGGNGEMTISPIKLEISGDLRLNANGISRNIMDELMRDKTFMQSLSDIITRELNKKVHGGVTVSDKARGFFGGAR